MANNPITVPLPQDLPETWAANQIVSPDGVSAGLTPQHGYNYLMQQVNNAQIAAQEVGEAIPLLADTALSNLNNPQKALSNLGAGVQPNLLDNAYFLGGGTGWGVFPVNQKGQTVYNQIGDLFDRWKEIYGKSWSVQLLQTGLQLTGGVPYTDFIQMLRSPLVEGNIYTLTAFFSGGTVATGQISAPKVGSISAGNVYLAAASYMRLNRVDGDTFEIIVVQNDSIPVIEFLKLEPGSIQTAAYQKPDGTWAMLPQNLHYGRDLLNCQQYLQLYRTESLRPTYAADCRPVMRIDPTPGTLLINGVTYYTNSAEL